MEQNVVSPSAQAPALSGNLLSRRLGTILSVFIFLLPIFFIPSQSVGLYVAKILLLATGLVAVFAIYLSSVLASGNIEIPKSKYLIPIALFGLIALLSSIFSGNIPFSIAGDVFDLGTSGSILMLVFTLFITTVAVKSVGVVAKAVNALVYSAIVLAVYTLFASYIGPYLPNAISANLPYFLTGSVIDLAIIFGAVVIVALCALNMAELSKRMRYVLYVLLAVGLVFVGASSFMPVIIMLGLVALVYFVYLLSWSVGRKVEDVSEVSGGHQGRQISLSALIVFMLCLVFMLGGSNVGGYLSRALKIQTTEIRPNFESTMGLTREAWKQNIALGIGPNNFSKFWTLHKPLEINQTQFWNSDFYAGSGFVPTIAITTGLLGLLSLIAFIGMYALSGVKAMYAQANSARSRYLATTTFLVSIYLWIMLFLYTPGLSVLGILFIFTGLFTSTLVPQGIAGSWKINIFSNPKTNFVAVLSTVVVLALSVAGGYLVWERGVASVVFQSGLGDFAKTNDLAKVKESTARAISIVPSDVYFRGYTEASMADLNSVLGGISNQSQVTDEVKQKIQNLIVDSVDAAKKATEVNSESYLNWYALGRVYEILAANGIEGSIENARASYKQAEALAPTNPAIPLGFARLDIVAKNYDSAKQNLNKAISLKNNYTDAYYTLAQIEAATNNVQGAIKAVEAASFVDPQNTGLLFQLGVMKYNTRDFAGARQALEKAIQLVPDYANARYFLALSLEKLGDKEGTLRELREILKTNPENKDVAEMIANVEAGKSAIPQAAQTNNIEKKTSAPIKEAE